MREDAELHTRVPMSSQKARKGRELKRCNVVVYASMRLRPREGRKGVKMQAKRVC